MKTIGHNSVRVLFQMLITSIAMTGYAVAAGNLQAGDAAYNAHDMTKAIQQYQIELKNNPDSLEARIGLAKCYSKKGYKSSSSTLIEEVLLMDSSNEDALLLKSAAYIKQKKFDEASQLIDRVLNVDPDNITAHSYLVRIHNALGDFETAEQLAVKIKTLRAGK